MFCYAFSATRCLLTHIRSPIYSHVSHVCVPCVCPTCVSSALLSYPLPLLVGESTTSPALRADASAQLDSWLNREKQSAAESSTKSEVDTRCCVKGGSFHCCTLHPPFLICLCTSPCVCAPMRLCVCVSMRLCVCVSISVFVLVSCGCAAVRCCIFSSAPIHPL